MKTLAAKFLNLRHLRRRAVTIPPQPPEEREQLHAEVAAFLLGKTITGVRFTDPDLSERDDGLELIFSDGTEIEMYAFAVDDAGELIGHHGVLLWAFVPDDLDTKLVKEA